MKHVKIAGRNFELAPRWLRLVAFCINCAVFIVAFWLLMLFFFVTVGIVVLVVWLILVILDFFLHFAPWLSFDGSILYEIVVAISALAAAISGSCLLKPGNKLLGIQVIRLKDGSLLNLKETFLRSLVAFFQPLDIFCVFWPEQQRLADKLAGTIVVRVTPEKFESLKTMLFARQTETLIENDDNEPLYQAEDREEVLETSMEEIKDLISEAYQKVDASLDAEKQLQAAHESSLAQADRYYANAMTALQAEREDSAREELRKRNGYQHIAEQCQKHWEAQNQVVGALNNLLTHLQQQVTDIENKKAGIVAQHRNVDAEVHLREILQEIQENPLMKINMDATEVITSAQKDIEAYLTSQKVELEEEFAAYAEEAAIDKDLAELKAKSQT